MTTYPRDLIGYGRNPPDPRWPGGARVAVQFVINYEEGGERNILHGDATSEAFLSDVLGAQPWPGQRHMNVESMYEYGSRAGFWRLWRLFTERRMPVTVFGVATALARHPEAVAGMREAGWEIASHGLKWIDYRDMPEAEERAHLARRSASTPKRPASGRSAGIPGAARSTRSSSSRGRRLSLFVGFLCRRSALLGEWPERAASIIPYTLDANDMRFINRAGLRQRRRILRLSQGCFDLLYAEGETRAEDDVGRPALPVGGRPGPRGGAARFLDYVARHERVWVARGSTSRGTGIANIEALAAMSPDGVVGAPRERRRSLDS